MPVHNNKEPIAYSKSKSNFVHKLAKVLNTDVKTLAIFWNRAKAQVAADNDCKLRIPDDYAVIVDIFKREIVKYFPDIVTKYPNTFSKELLKHRHPPTESLDQVLKRYRREIKEVKQQCGGQYTIIKSRR